MFEIVAPLPSRPSRMARRVLELRPTIATPGLQESTPREMLAVGGRAALVAVVGVVTPMLLGYGTGLLFRPREPWMLHAFLGAMLAATSRG